MTCARLLGAFDIEIIAEEKAFMIQSGRYGLGAQKPTGNIPVKIRKP